ncbi:hypothetical protein POM88_011177 [Heracleum sosnowskyi]|uniref:Uncharacterized protein n=1 Tax=Heracleum sosnowskyi TaxID=360622 RepID=A0AAD8IV08_9APIA|nr:hypothetical protein POM88_011177 [Heracleum sosnowskyi]
MAEALGSLKTIVCVYDDQVKGIEKFCKSTESSKAESSVESPEKNVVTSPKTTRTGRRKHVREGSGVVQTVTPVARGKNRVPVASVKTVQTVYNTRLSSRLLKREVMEMEKKESVEAVKISSYCDVASHNDYGEVSEEKNNPGSDNEGVESLITEDEQESERLKWKDADKDLESRHKAATNLKSILPENNGIQVDTTEAVLEMPSDDKMAVIEKPLHNKKDYFAVDLCPSRTDISTEVLVHEGSVNVDVELPCFEVEEGSEFLKGKDADRDSDSIDSAAINMDPEVLENNRLQVDTIEDVLEIPSDDNAAVLEEPLYNKNDVSCLSRTDISTEVFAHEGSVDVDVELPFSDVEQGSEFLKGKDADIDVVLSDSAAINMEPKVLANKGLQVDTIEDVLEMTRDDNMAVLEKPLHNKNGSANVDVEFPFFEVEEGSEFLKEKDADRDSDLSDSAAINMEPRVLENNRLQVDTIEDGLEIPNDDNTAVLEKSLDNKNGYFDVDLCSSRTDISTKVLAHEGSVNVDVELPCFEVEEGSEFLKGKDADIELDLSDSAAINMEPKVLENMGLQVDTIEDVLEMPSDDCMAVLEKPLHDKDRFTWSDVFGAELCLSKTDISIELLAHEGSVDVGVDSPVPQIEQESESLKWKDADKDQDSGDIAAANMKSKVLENNEFEGLQVDTIEAILEMLSEDTMAVIDKPLHNKKGSVYEAVELPVFEIEIEREPLKWNDADEDLDLSDTAAANLTSKVLENTGLQMDTILESVFEMTSDDNMVVTDKPLHKKKDNVGVDLCLSKTDVLTKVLAHEGSYNVGVDSSISEIEESSEFLNGKKSDKDLDSRDPTATNMKSHVLENNWLQLDTVESVLEMSRNDISAVVDLALNNKKVEESFQVIPLKPISEMPSNDSKAVVDMLHHKMRDDVVVDRSPSGVDMTTEILAHEVELLTTDTQMAMEETPIRETKADEQVFSSPKNGSDNVGVHFTFLEGSDDVGVQFSFLVNDVSFLENDENVDAAVTSSTDSKESDSLKEQLKLESSEKLNCGELVQDLMIQPMSEKNVLDCSEVKFPSFFKQSGQMCPSSAPSVLPPRKAKIAGNEPPLIMADYPFTRKHLTPGPNFKLKSNVSNDKENMEQNEKKVEVTKEKAHKDKKEFGVGKKSDVWLHVRSPR